jgi:hypothetical protein
LTFGTTFRLKRLIRPGRFIFVGARRLDLGDFSDVGGRGFGRCHPHAATPASVLESIQF